MSNEVSVIQPPEVKTGQAKVIKIEDVQAGKISETVINTTATTASELLTQVHGGDTRTASLTENGRGLFGKYRSLREAATTSEFPVLLQSGLKAILFDSYNGVPVVYPQLVMMETSDKPAEDYLEGNTFGTLPQVGEGQNYPDVDTTLDRVVRITNSKYGGIFSVTEEMVLFDKVGMIRQLPADLGRAMRQTIEETVIAGLTATGSFVRNSTTNDNDVGANTAATTFSAGGLLTAHRTIRTAKDRKSGRYLGIVPDTLLVAPGVEWAAKQLLLGNNLVRASANNAAEVYGTGQENPLRGLVSTIVVSPLVATTFGWLLFQKQGFAVLQEVIPLRFMAADAKTSDNEDFFKKGKLSYRVDAMFGFGILNDRLGYLSSSTTTPAVG